MPPQVLAALPKLPEDIEYRFIGDRLILLDVHAHSSSTTWTPPYRSSDVPSCRCTPAIVTFLLAVCSRRLQRLALRGARSNGASPAPAQPAQPPRSRCRTSRTRSSSA